MTLPANRTGVIARKVGMTRFFDESGSHVPVTVLSLDGLQVVGQRSQDKDGYVALQLGAGTRKAKNTTKSERGSFAKAGVEPTRVTGYDKVSFGHLAAAYCVVTGEADTCLATRSAAQTFNLDFVPLHSERYDLVMRRRTADLPAIKAFLDVLQRATLRRKLEVLAGYDTSQTGSVLLY